MRMTAAGLPGPIDAHAPESALSWARSHIVFDQCEPIRQSPWGTTLRLEDGSRGHRFYLKVLGPQRPDAVAATAAIAGLLHDIVAPVIAFDARRGFLLSADHGGAAAHARLGETFVGHVLTTYAVAQARATLDRDQLARVPRFTLEDAWLRAQRFLDGRTASGNRAGLADFVGTQAASLLAGAVDMASAPLLRALGEVALLPLTIEHGDLHPGNLAITPSGDLRLHDWEDALLGPAGLSFSGLVSPTADLADGIDGAGPVARLAAGYASSLAAAGYASRDRLRRALPASVLAGLFVRLAAYADHPPADAWSREVCVPDLERIGTEILDWCCRLGAADTAVAGRLMRLFAEHRRSGELLALARRIEGDALDLSVREAAGREALPVAVRETARLVRAQRLARRAEALPCLSGLQGSPEDSEVEAVRAEVLCAMLDEHGCVVLEGLFAPELLRACLAYQQAECERVSGARSLVGDRRTMQPVPVAGPFNTPDFYAHPLLAAAMTRLLGTDFVIGSVTLVTSMPGARAQHLHADHPPLFPESSAGPHLPAHAFTVLVPLVDLDETVGGTEVFKGSHRSDDPTAGDGLPCVMRRGDCLVLDYRLAHRGMANRSGQARPVLSIVYQRAWFRDAVNFAGDCGLVLPSDERQRVPGSFADLFRFAGVADESRHAP